MCMKLIFANFQLLHGGGDKKRRADKSCMGGFSFQPSAGEKWGEGGSLDPHLQSKLGFLCLSYLLTATQTQLCALSLVFYMFYCF